MPTAPAAPDLLVMTTGCFSTFSSAVVNGRPARSAWPPGGYGFTMVIGRVGNASCAAAGATATSARRIEVIASVRIDGSFGSFNRDDTRPAGRSPRAVRAL